MPGNVRQTFWNKMFQRGDGAPGKITQEISDMVIKQHLWSPSCWAVFPIQDLLAVDGQLKAPNPQADQINVPANPQHYWRWRLNVKMEVLILLALLGQKYKY
jgi:4-alpha-glucanotransferase